MEWYQGSIEQAIKQVREGNSFLCVLVKDDKETSNELISAITAVSHLFHGYTTIQLTYGTATCKQFSVYYPILVIPSLYIIDGNGVCLAVVADKDKLVSIVTEATQNKTPAAQRSSESSSPPASTVLSPSASAVLSPSASSASPPTVPANDISNTVTPESVAALLAQARPPVALSPPATTSLSPPATTSLSLAEEQTQHTQTNGVQDASSPTPQLTLEERKERAKQLLDEKKRREEEEVQEAVKQKERERREHGQTIAEQKRKREEENMKKISESIRREKITQKAEMEAIREQIARDKAERKGEKYTPEVATTPSAPATPSVREGKVRIEIKFPATGTTLLRTFDDTCTLAVVVDYIKEELQKDNFTLWNTYPRRQYKSGDLGESLASLGLSGSVSLLGMSGKGYTPAPTPVSAPEEQAGPSTAGLNKSSNDRPLSQARIQFKKTDGTSLLQIFDEDTKLVDVIKHFQTQSEEDLGESVLWSLYPRYEITHEHVQQTLSQLNMCPSAVIFVVSPDKRSPANPVGQNSGILIWELVLAMFQLPVTILQYLKNILFPARPQTRPRPPPLTPPSSASSSGPSSEEPADGPVIPHPAPQPADSGGLRKRTRLDGNVTRLSNNTSPEEDDTNTWNGNSTQLQ